MPEPTAPQPMLAKAVAGFDKLPAGQYLYEPKWDGFRGIVVRSRDGLEIGSRGSKPLTRYFPELVDAFIEQLPVGCVVDGELVVRSGQRGAERLDWPTLAQRIHPAASRITMLSGQTPASFIAFDLLAVEGQSLTDEPFSVRRERLEQALAHVKTPIHLSRVTRDQALAQLWFTEFEGAGLDGVIAKPVAGKYEPNKRTLFKIKHSRSAEAVVVGYRIHRSGSGVGSLLLGLFTDNGDLRLVGGASAFSDKRRLELIEELDPLVVRDDDGNPVRGSGDQNRFSSGKDTSFVVLRPELVVEVKYDQMEGDRFRHTVQVLRFRPDREASSCTYDQLDRPVAYDLGSVIIGA